MIRSLTMITMAALTTAGLGLLIAAPASAQSVMQQCGQQYQAAKAANTLNGMTWNQYRSECSARLKAQPASAPAAAAPAVTPLKPAPAVVTTPAVVAPKPAPAVVAAPAPAPAVVPATTAAAPVPAGTKPMSPGREAFVTRERQCGAEWKANKVSLKASTPGITWPKYLSQCNTRLKAAGQ